MTIAQIQLGASRVRLGAAWAIVVAGCAAAYWAGLGGPFLFDDFGTVAALGDYGGVTNWETFKSFVFHGNAGPTGRPLSLATFLIDGTQWPTDPWPFKRTNLVIHLLNGALLGVLTLQVLRIAGLERRQAHWAALLSAAAWLLHPFLVSTTLYVVQRMTQLSALFVLAGLVGYLYGRMRLESERLKAYVIMSGSLGLGTVLAVLSKENGALLPLLAGVLEITVLASNARYRGNLDRAWSSTFIVLPSVVIVAYLAYKATSYDFFATTPPRDFSLFERLLTQPRVLTDYLYNWFIPKLYTTGVFQDHFLKSTGLLAPVTTLLAIILQGGLAVLAFLRRREWPLFALAVLFFFAGHLLESSVLNLEMYFEHRNYLPAAFLFLPLAALAVKKLEARTFIVAGCAVLLLLGGFTRFAATIWQDYSMIVAASAHKAPTSARAQGQYAMDYFNAGHADKALAVIDEALENIPGHNSYLVLMRLNVLCASGDLDPEAFRRTADDLSRKYYDPRLVKSYSKLISSVVQNRCPEIKAQDLKRLFDDMLEVPLNSNPEQLGYSHLHYFVGYTQAYMDDPAAALASFRTSLDSRPGAGHAMAMAALLATRGYFDEALTVSELALGQIEADKASEITGNRVSEADIRHFQDVVRADRAALQGSGS
jgi:tetratricopeptide (TPR) repeat protein